MTTKPEKKQQRRPSPHGARKSAVRKNKQADHLTTYLKAARLLTDESFKEFDRSVMEQRKAERSRTLPAHEAALLEVFKLGPKVFENKNKFISWLSYPRIPLGGKTPLQLIVSKKADLVRDELLRIEYGVFA